MGEFVQDVVFNKRYPFYIIWLLPKSLSWVNLTRTNLFFTKPLFLPKFPIVGFAIWNFPFLFQKYMKIPDFDLLNQIDGVQGLPDFKANVYSDGTVIWRVAGGIQAFCAFTGLANIPYDTLGCQLLFSDHSRKWSRYSNLVNYVFKIPDVTSVGVFDRTYDEWTMIPELTNQGLTPTGDIFDDIYFKRAVEYYFNIIVVRCGSLFQYSTTEFDSSLIGGFLCGILILEAFFLFINHQNSSSPPSFVMNSKCILFLQLPTIILTYLSFFTYLLDLRIG